MSVLQGETREKGGGYLRHGGGHMVAGERDHDQIRTMASGPGTTGVRAKQMNNDMH